MQNKRLKYNFILISSNHWHNTGLIHFHLTINRAKIHPLWIIIRWCLLRLQYQMKTINIVISAAWSRIRNLVQNVLYFTASIFQQYSIFLLYIYSLCKNLLTQSVILLYGTRHLLKSHFIGNWKCSIQHLTNFDLFKKN